MQQTSAATLVRRGIPSRRRPPLLILSVGKEDAMNPTMKDLGIDRLSPEQRVALALEIWESLGDTRPPARLTTEQRTELARRDAELDANPGIALTWEQIRASVETKP
jgi:putative addiction module component (TIGR02574 family)